MHVDLITDQIYSLIRPGLVASPSENVEIRMFFNVSVFDQFLARLVRTLNSRGPLIHNLDSEMSRHTRLANHMNS